jgi:L-fuconolactonase
VLIIDHLSKPPIGRDETWISGWERNLRAAAANPNVLAKVSGLFPAGRDLADWTAEDVRPFLHVALEAFGADRLMWGSDWPIVELAGGYDKAWRELDGLFAELSPAERAALRGGTAARAYRIGPREA